MSKSDGSKKKTKSPGGKKTSAAKKKASKKKATKKKATKKKTAAKKKATKKKTAAKKTATKKKAKAKKKTTKKKTAARKSAEADSSAVADADEAEDAAPKKKGPKALVIVESPAKAKTINKYLGKGYHVMASMGHVRDLPKNRIGIDLEETFEPEYEPLPDKKKVISEIRKHARGAEAIYLACDMDREGEAIAWHIAELLPSKKDAIHRVTFNQITKAAIERAFQAPRGLDMNKVYAQQARRLLDRIVGYKLSQLLWKKVRRGLSAGRVQSVALKMVVEREKEIRAFVPVEYWEVGALFDSARLRGDEAPAARGEGEDEALPAYRFRTSLHRINEDRLDPDGFRIEDEAQAREWERKLGAASYAISKVEEKERRNNPKKPFITSTLQQSASSELSFGTKRTMRIAQQLYEGIELGSEGAVGLITYMRTDSVHLAPEAVEEARGYIEQTCGADYVPAEPNVFKRAKQKVQAQEAHEAIRPTETLRTPDSLKKHLTPEQLKLYDLIWRRFVACQAKPARFKAMTIEVSGEVEGGDVAVFRATGQRLLFDGHLRILGKAQTDRLLPALEEAEALDLVPPLDTVQKFTSPPPRFNEASLVKRLEAEGIGRPSTYSSIISTIQDRGYVEAQNRALHATTKGEVVTDKLASYFDEIMDYGYTRQMEENLDRVEGALEDEDEDEDAADAADLSTLDWKDLIRSFYGEFNRDLARAQKEMKHVNDDAPDTEHDCPKCGSTMRKMYNTNEFTRFLGCSAYPECKTTIPLDEEGRPQPEKEIDEPCPKCGERLVLKSGRRGRFFACSAYPECKQTLEVGADGEPVPPPDVEADCPECEEEMVVRRGRLGPFLGCPRYPKCRGTLPIVKNASGEWEVGERGQKDEMPKVDVKCERCGSPMAIKRSGRGPFLGCTGYPKCRATAKVPDDVEVPPPPEPEAYGEDCEQCGKPLVVRQGRRGPFVACSGYPKCRNTRNLPAQSTA